MKERKRNIALRLAAVLVVLTCISTAMLSGILGRYTASGSGGDSARVASFSVSAAGKNPDSTAVGASSGTATYVLTVTNNSEVAVSYTVELEFDAALPDWVTITLGDSAMVISADRKTATATVSGVLAVGGETTENIVFTASTAGLTQSAAGVNTSQTFQFTANVKFVQID